MIIFLAPSEHFPATTNVYHGENKLHFDDDDDDDDLFVLDQDAELDFYSAS